MKEYVYIPRDINTRFPKVWESKDSLLIWLFIGLLFNADDKGAATISPAAFAQRVRCSERRMREALKTIEDAGYIAITGDNGDKTTISIINYSNFVPCKEEEDGSKSTPR